MNVLILNELFDGGKEIIAFHGTRSIFPFERFDAKMIGSGLVSNSGSKYEGFFFTSSQNNAEFYSEYFVAKVRISEVKPAPKNIRIPKEVLKIAKANKSNYLIEDILDGGFYSDIITVPSNNLDTVKIIEWYFIGDEEMLYEQYDILFEGEDEEINRDMILDRLEDIGCNFDYLLNIPLFKKYYYSKS